MYRRSLIVIIAVLCVAPATASGQSYPMPQPPAPVFPTLPHAPLPACYADVVQDKLPSTFVRGGTYELWSPYFAGTDGSGFGVSRTAAPLVTFGTIAARIKTVAPFKTLEIVVPANAPTGRQALTVSCTSFRRDRSEERKTWQGSVVVASREALTRGAALAPRLAARRTAVFSVPLAYRGRAATITFRQHHRVCRRSRCSLKPYGRTTRKRITARASRVRFRVPKRRTRSGRVAATIRFAGFTRNGVAYPQLLRKRLYR